MFDKLKDKTAGMTQSVTQGVQAGMNSLGDFKEKSASLIASSLEEINGLRPILEQSGFIVGDIFINVALPPSVGLIVEQEVGGSAKLDAIDSAELSTVQNTIVGSIKKIYALNDVVEEHEHTIGQVEITLGLPPQVKAHLNSKKSRAFTSREEDTAQSSLAPPEQ
jgi:hypothetical protein